MSLRAPSDLMVALNNARDEATDMCGLNISSPPTVAVMSGYCLEDDASTIHKRFQDR